MLTAKIDTPHTLSLENIQTSMRITHTSRFCVLFLNVWYLAYYIFQENQCICDLISPIRKADANKNACLRVEYPNYSWKYKGRIPLKNVKVKLVLPFLFKLYMSNSFKHVGGELDRFLFLSNTFNTVSTQMDRMNGIGCS
jgi:hypothetical protein